MKRIYLLLSLLTGCLYMQAAIYNVRDFGAKADGKTIDSPAINRAIEACRTRRRRYRISACRRICLLFHPAEKQHPSLSGTRRTHHRRLSGKGRRIRLGGT